MTTITIGAGAAVAGAVGLALAGLGAAALGLGRRRGRRKGSYRYGRSISDETEALERVMSTIRQQDVSGCGLRLACELGGKPEEQLTVEELSILDLIGEGVRPGEGVLPGRATGEYKAARGYGEQGADCALAYPTCAFDGNQMMNAVMEYLP